MAPVVSAALGAFGPLLVKITSLLTNECGRLKGVRREIRSELVSMHGALKKYTKLDDPDDQVKEWISLVRELAYDTEDCFDKFIHQLGNDRPDSGFKEFFRQMARRLKTLGARRGIANQIDNLKVRIKEVKEFRISYRVGDTACGSSHPTSHQAAVDPRLPALFAEEAHLVGIDGPIDDLAKWMLDEGNTHHRMVLSIVGFGGLGKTTLANEVYRKIQGHFHCHAFVSVSQKPDTKKIIKDVILQVSSDDEFTKDIEIWDEKKSIAKLRELLKDKRYVLIIDDIWSVVAWNAIKCAFPENNCSSRIIATTRIFELASSCCPGPDDQIYPMSPLSNLHAERLFFKRIFGSEDCCPDMLNEVASAILHKCGGLRLAIISISGLLANKRHVKEEWEKVKRSIGSDLNKSQSLEGMKNILFLSYNDLPSNLKTCLLYLSIFPEDDVIERNRLVRRWIAEGFISEERGRSCQEVAENYFYELINKSMVQPVGLGYDGKVTACRVHDMMLELIISKSIEENFITVVNGRQTVWENSQCVIRRLSIQHIDEDLASELAKKDLRHVRSLTVTSSSCIKYLPSLAEFPNLRVLDFEGCIGLECLKKDEGSIERRRRIRRRGYMGSEYLKEYDMNGMKDLFYLKYLSFRKTRIPELPSGVMMLHDLVTLDLRDTYITEFPAGIVRLIKLQHLLIEHSYEMSKVKVPIGVGYMTKLQEILGFNITMSSVRAVEELGSLINLNVLHVRYILEDTESDNYRSHAEMLLSSLCKLGSYQLQSLHIEGGGSSPFELLDSWSPPPSRLQKFKMSAYYRLSKLPKWITPALTSLEDIEINLSEVTEEDLHMLGELPSLLHLKLMTDRVQRDRLLVKGRGFSCLNRFVCAVYGTVSGSLLFEEGAMPKLEEFFLTLGLRRLASREEAYGFYLGIERLQRLKVVEVDVYSCSMDDHDISCACKAKAAIRKEAYLHPNCPRVTVCGEELNEEQSDSNDEVNEEQNDAGDEVNEEQSDADDEVNGDQSDASDEVNEEQSDADEYCDTISSLMLEGNSSP